MPIAPQYLGQGWGVSSGKSREKAVRVLAIWSDSSLSRTPFGLGSRRCIMRMSSTCDTWACLAKGPTRTLDGVDKGNGSTEDRIYSKVSTVSCRPCFGTDLLVRDTAISRQVTRCSEILGCTWTFASFQCIVPAFTTSAD
jgi:hypothetical protein